MGVGIPAVAALTVLTRQHRPLLPGRKLPCRRGMASIPHRWHAGIVPGGVQGLPLGTSPFNSCIARSYQVWIVLFVAVLNVSLNLLAIPQVWHQWQRRIGSGLRWHRSASPSGSGGGNLPCLSPFGRFFSRLLPPRRWSRPSTRCAYRGGLPLAIQMTTGAWFTVWPSSLSTSWDCGAESLRSWPTPRRQRWTSIRELPEQSSSSRTDDDVRQE